jgi:hypothetical protein
MRAEGEKRGERWCTELMNDGGARSNQGLLWCEQGKAKEGKARQGSVGLDSLSIQASTQATKQPSW